MKTSLCLCLAVIFGAVPVCSGQMPVAPMHPHSLSLQVEPLGAGDKIEISVRNFGRVSDAARVEWYFMAAPAHPVSGKAAIDQVYVFDKGSQSVNLTANGTARIPVTSKEVTAGTARKAGPHTAKSHGNHNGGEKKETGDVLSGWIVRVVADGKVIEAKAPKQVLEDLARDNARLGSAAKG